MTISINSGKHYSNVIFPKLVFNEIRGYVNFDGDFSYSLPKEKQKDTNKLIGISDSYHHHVNSIRLGWRWNEKESKLEIMTILYSNRERHIEHLCYIDDKDKYYYFSIKIHKGLYWIHFGETAKCITRNNKWFLPRYVLFPYFGGTERAPKNFNFRLELI